MPILVTWRTAETRRFLGYLKLLNWVCREKRRLTVRVDIALGSSATTNDDFRPSRRVRTVPGGEQTFTFEDGSDEPLEPLSKVFITFLLFKKYSVTG